MLRTVVKLIPSFSFPIFRNANEYDKDVLKKKVQSVPETGWDRVKKMYSINEFGEVSVELHTVTQSTLAAAFIGSCLGGFVQSRNAYVYFIENNQATIFKTTLEAKKKLQDYVLIAFCKGAVRWGWRLAAFTGIFNLIATTLAVYNGNTSLIEYVAAGTITGALYKLNMGLAATIVGAGLGAVLSTVAGFAILGILKATGLSMDDIRRTLYKIKQAREDQMNQAKEKACTVISEDPLIIHHKQIVEERGEKTLAEIVS